jgi:hypothetical protein
MPLLLPQHLLSRQLRGCVAVVVEVRVTNVSYSVNVNGVHASLL